MAVKVIIFDFDGTIADTYEAIVDVTNSLAAEFDYQQVSQAELAQLKALSSREIIKRSKISIFKIPFLLKRVKEELGKKIETIEPFDRIETALSALKQQGYQLGIVTSNSEENVVAFLEKNGLDSLFTFIYSGTSLFGKHHVIRSLLKQRGVAAKEVVYVGDETRDIEAAKKSRVKVISVGWGFNAPSVLAQHQPDCLIQHPQELVQVVKNWNKPMQKAL
ncbi:MAG: HAD-IA family hydrolase [Cyanophyceae cyanobacterium]